MENDCDLPTTVTIVDEAGNMVFARTGEALQLEEEKIFLSRGSYQLMIDYNTENLIDD